jgi:hypothetical protein
VGGFGFKSTTPSKGTKEDWIEISDPQAAMQPSALIWAAKKQYRCKVCGAGVDGERDVPGE